MMFGVSGHRLAVPPSASRATAVGAAVSRGADSSQTAEDAPSVRTRARAAEKSVDRAVARGRECDGELCLVGEPECRRLPGVVRSSAFWKTWTRRRLTGETPSLPGRGPAGAAVRRRGRSSGDPSTLQATRREAGAQDGSPPSPGWPGPARPLRPPAPPWAPRCPRHEWADDGDLARHGDGRCSPAHARRGPSVPARATEAQAPQVLPRRGGLREGPGCRAGREVTRGGCAWRGPSDLTEGLAIRSRGATPSPTV